MLRHKEIYLKNDGHQPQIAREPWEGIWIPKVKWNESGINKFSESTHASDVGQVLAKDYLPFLIEVRKILELPDSIECRIKLLRDKPSEGDWLIYVEKHGGIERIIRQFFPRFIYTLPKINDATITELSKLGLDTPNSIAAAPDEVMLNINGIGQAKLKSIRDYCAGISNNRDDNRLAKVTR